MEFCSCNGTILNTGTPSKQRVIGTGVKLIAVQLKADDGTFNQIDKSEVIDQAYLDAKINHEDPSKRWYPIGSFTNEEDVRGDAITETFSDGSSAITQQGVRSYTGWNINSSPAYEKILDSFKCTKFGIYSIDSCGGLTGSISVDGDKLNPIRINEYSWNPTYVKATPTTVAKTQIMFEFDQTEKDANLRVINETEITADLLRAEGLTAIKGVASSITTTGFVLALTIDFDIFLDASKSIVPDWEASDFAVFNNTTNSAVAITSVTEAPKGTYTFVIPAQSASDELTVTNVKTSGNKPGVFLDVDITIPS